MTLRAGNVTQMRLRKGRGQGRCPSCQRLLDGITGVELRDEREPERAARPVKPQPGSITACAYCGTILAFGPHMELQLATQLQIDFLHPDVKRVLAEFTKTRAKSHS